MEFAGQRHGDAGDDAGGAAHDPVADPDQARTAWGR
jgi:hypothetical protein